MTVESFSFALGKVVKSAFLQTKPSIERAKTATILSSSSVGLPAGKTIFVINTLK